MSRVIDLSNSAHARLQPLPVSAVRLTDAFWEPRREVNRKRTLPSQYRLCAETGRIDNFRRAAGKKQVPFQGRYYNDSDVYKWVEACSYAAAGGADPELAGMLNRVVAEIRDAQAADGYLNTYFTFERAGERWTNLRDLHELYCAGHLFQAAAAHFRCTGQRDLLDAALRYADLICRVFGPEGREGTCGHQEIEMALVELYRITGNERYLNQARLFIERRGLQPPALGGSAYHQDHAPFRTSHDVVGHAVRMVYYCCGAADVYAETGDPEYRAALERLWESMVQRRMYVTGGIGSRYEGEAFGADYELPNDRAYGETCAAIGSVMWSWRMLLLTGEARFADLVETALFNGVAPGLSLDGELYFYQNPLGDAGTHRRQPWFECACCPPNIARLLASLPGYFYTTSKEGVWTHLYASGHAAATLPDGLPVLLTQQTRYPWEGEVRITVNTQSAAPFSLFYRIPAWCEGASAAVNNEHAAAAGPESYMEIHRVWEAGDEVRLHLPMQVERLRCHPYVTSNSGRVALRRGPLVYCVEQVDLDGVDPREILLPPGSELAPRWEPDLLGGVVALHGTALSRRTGDVWKDRLYLREGEAPAGESRPVELTAVPYYAWANREPGAMAVWLAAE